MTHRLDERRWEILPTLTGGNGIYHYHPEFDGSPWIGVQGPKNKCISCSDPAPKHMVVALKLLEMGEPLQGIADIINSAQGTLYGLSRSSFPLHSGRKK